jgi:hypothetical protein
MGVVFGGLGEFIQPTASQEADSPRRDDTDNEIFLPPPVATRLPPPIRGPAVVWWQWVRHRTFLRKLGSPSPIRGPGGGMVAVGEASNVPEEVGKSSPRFGEGWGGGYFTAVGQNRGGVTRAQRQVTNPPCGFTHPTHPTHLTHRTHQATAPARRRFHSHPAEKAVGASRCSTLNQYLSRFSAVKVAER